MLEKLKTAWRTWRFDQMAVMVNDRIDNPAEADVERYVGLEHLDSDSLTIRRWGSPSDVEATKLRFRAGDIIFGRRRVYQRKLAVAHFDGICSAHAMVLRAKPEVALPEFLPYFMQSDLFMERAKQISVGSLSPTINWKTLAQEEFALPPLEEQRIMAGALQSCDRGVETHGRLLDAIWQVETSAFSDLTSRSKTHPIGLRELLTQPPRNGHSVNEAASPTGHWVLALNALSTTGYRRGELKPVMKTPAMSAALLRKDDLLISRSNTRELVGLAGIFDEDRVDVSWPDTMMRLVPDESRVRKKYLEQFLRSPWGRKQIESFAAGTSASMKKINGTNVGKLQILLPTLREQDEIVAKADSLRAAHDTTCARLSVLLELRRAMLNKDLSHA